MVLQTELSYLTFRKNRRNGKGGGVVLLISHDISGVVRRILTQQIMVWNYHRDEQTESTVVGREGRGENIGESHL